MRDNFVGTQDAAAHLGISKNTLDQWCSAKKISYYLVGGKRRFKVTELDSFIESTRVEAQ